MYARTLEPLDGSFFLFGARGVGKSTWLKQRFPDALFVDLLPPAESLRFAKDPSLLSALVRGRTTEGWIAIDEVQKNPPLLDEVHHLMENHGYRRFVLCGSSARKLRRGAANLLAGRALNLELYPLTSKEIGFEIEPRVATEYGLLPMSVKATSARRKEAFLASYLTTYISEEIKAEGLVRDIGSFARFLDIAALSAATAPNISGLARDAGISRDTVAGYFEVFVDTLLGSWLPAHRPRSKVKETARPKFYWFDSGVLNAAAGAFSQPMPRDWRGVLLEHWIHHELKAYMHYRASRGSLGYWRTPSGSEVDFVWWYGDKTVGIEVKSATGFRREYLKGLKAILKTKKLDQAIVVYLGSEILRYDGIDVLPVIEFLQRLWSDRIIPVVA